jgi:2-polyprenyl-3-methyl-5-hydroxy-6-metoxy-1,4-benzoquinol methylase
MFKWINRKMNIKNLEKYLNKPIIYTNGNAQMWTDPYISKHLLDAHLNQSVDAASRNFKDIDQTVDWLSNMIKNPNASILDLGCGPGLYTQRFAKKGYQVTGVDFSETSIQYAKEQASKNNLNILYNQSNYLSYEFNEKYDLIYMIYCDFAVLSFAERKILVNNIFNALKPNGLFVFDAYNESFLKTKTFDKDFEYDESGFWTDKPYLCLNQSYHYKEHKVILDQHIVLTDDSEPKVYRFYNQYMNLKDVSQYFLPFGFSNIKVHENVIEDENINFYSMRKI